MSDATHWTDVVVAISAVSALVVAIVSAMISYKSRNDSKRSADAAEKSANIASQSADAADRSADASEKSADEAIKARKLNQFQTLSIHFANIDRLLSSYVREGIIYPEVTEAITSIKHLKGALSKDQKLIELLDYIFNSISNEEIQNFIRPYRGGTALFSLRNCAPGALSSIISDFEKKKREYLDIGLV